MMHDRQRTRSAVSLNDVEVAFRHLNTRELQGAYLLFSMMRSELLVRWGSACLKLAFALHLPIAWIVKKTLFRQFCGGEDLAECQALSQRLAARQVGVILDYAVEGKETEEDFAKSAAAVCSTIEATKQHSLPFVVFKATAVARFALLEKISARRPLNRDEEGEWQRVVGRVTSICQTAASAGVRVLIDAEESWIQTAIDELAVSLMQQFNTSEVVVYLTLQLYRHDRLAYLHELRSQAKKAGYRIGVKLVRGAYLEKERARAEAQGYPSPLHATKAATDAAYDQALSYCLNHINDLALFAGTHNEASSLLLAELVDRQGLERHDPRIASCQLFGMSDHLTFNLAHHGYHASKFIPFGPVAETLPYLLRRAAENSAMQSQSFREWGLLGKELARRKSLPQHKP